jgi:hypothetical protein
MTNLRTAKYSPDGIAIDDPQKIFADVTFNSITRTLVGGSAYPANTLAIVGDSFSARWRIQSGLSVDYRPQGYVMWALAFSGQRLSVVSDQSVGGAWVSQGGTVTPMVQQIDNAVASGARHLLLMGGINDIIGGASLATIQSAFIEIVTKALRANMCIWWCTQPQLNSAGAGYTIARQGTFSALNDWIRSLRIPGVVCIDSAAVVMDPASATGNYRTNYTQADNLHLTNVACMQLGAEVARVLSSRVPESPLLLSSTADTTSFSTNSNNILPNGLFLAGSPVATGFTQSVTGGAGVTPSIVARADGFGNDQQLVCTFAANNDSGVLTSGDLKANVALGDILTASCELNLSAMTATRTVRVQLVVAGSLGTKTMSWGQLDATVDRAMESTFNPWTVRLEPVQYTADLGTLTNVSLAVRAFGSGAGGVTVRVGRAAVRKSVPGPA